MSYLINVSRTGRVNLPASIRKKMGLTSGGALLVNETENGLVLSTISQSVAKAQALAQKYTANAPAASVDAFLAGRRADSGE
ncbi:MAG: AbrB/MazE/SpoVT family DNA-binding domain-containing protein [Aestuariivirga sp.]